ncbi:MAG: hypothetical protein IKS06_09420, partial [Lachnospiraceae bacterium]|nr:hypothetical protein [Lachnospiraceae bacterium]
DAFSEYIICSGQFIDLFFIFIPFSFGHLRRQADDSSFPLPPGGNGLHSIPGAFNSPQRTKNGPLNCIGLSRFYQPERRPGRLSKIHYQKERNHGTHRSEKRRSEAVL